ncbi:hypothetical protein Taro_013492 [Colocasia esculenta]|nr:hypothetical protein [Colocasia esculenta]
MKSGRH